MSLASGEQTKSNYDVIYGSYIPDKQLMIHTNDFKLVVYPHGKVMRLYNLKNDP